METDQADLWIQLHMSAHVRGALHDGLVQHLRAALIHIVFGKLGFGRSGLGHRFRQRAFLKMASLHDAGFVQVNVGFDQAGHHELPTQIEGFPWACVCAQGFDEIAVLHLQFAQVVIGAKPHIDDLHRLHALTPSPR